MFYFLCAMVVTAFADPYGDAGADITMQAYADETSEGLGDDEARDGLMIDALGTAETLAFQEVAGPLPVVQVPPPEAPARPWRAQLESRTAWGQGTDIATGARVNAAGGAWRVGAAASAAADTRLRDAYALYARGAHTWIAGWYTLGFAERLTFDTTAHLAPGGLVRGPATVAPRGPKLLGVGYAWHQQAEGGHGPQAALWAATHPRAARMGGAHVAYVYADRTRLAFTGYLASLAEKTTGALGVAATAGWRVCDAAAEMSYAKGGDSGAGALAAHAGASCAVHAGLRLGISLRETPRAFRNPFARGAHGFAHPRRRIAALWSTWGGGPGDASVHVALAWPHTRTGVSRPAFAARTRGQLVLSGRQTLTLAARTSRSHAARARLQHIGLLAWRSRARHGWLASVGPAWRLRVTHACPAHAALAARVSWRRADTQLGLDCVTGLDVAYLRGGVSVAHRVTERLSLALRAHAESPAARGGTLRFFGGAVLSWRAGAG